MTRIHAEREMRCPFSATVDFLTELGSEQRVGPFSSVWANVQCAFEAVPDHTDQSRRHQALQLHWNAPSRAPLPLMRGLVTVRPHGPVTQLRMDGTYVPPFGFLGQLFDWLIGRHLAQRTVDRFLLELCDFVNQAWKADCREHAATAHLF